MDKSFHISTCNYEIKHFNDSTVSEVGKISENINFTSRLFNLCLCLLTRKKRV